MGSRPIKILRVLTRLNIGGPAVHAALLSTQLDPRRFFTCLVAGEPASTEGDVSGLIHGAQVEVLRVKSLRRPVRPWDDLMAFARLLSIVWVERPHILHTHMAKAGTLGRLAGLLYNRFGPGRRPGARAVLVHTFHGHVLEGYFSPRVSRFFITIERWLAKRTDCLIAVSRTIREELLRKGIGREEQWRVVPLGVDLSGLAQLSFPNRTPEVGIGLVGRLVPIKNPGLFLEALHRVVRRPPAERAVWGMIVGDGPLRQELERQASRLGLDAVVRFTGWQQDLRSIYEGLKVACVTSWNEGTPVALIEAMAAGRAVVATDVGGVRDLLEDGDGRSPIPAGTFRRAARGLLVPPGDPVGLAAALTAIAGDQDLREQLGRSARTYVVERFSATRLCRDIAALYEVVLAGREGG